MSPQSKAFLIGTFITAGTFAFLTTVVLYVLSFTPVNNFWWQIQLWFILTVLHTSFLFLIYELNPKQK